MTPRKIDKRLSEELKRLRLRKGLSIRALADSVGIDPTYLSKLERGQLPPPSAGILGALAGVIGSDALLCMLPDAFLYESFSAFEQQLQRYIGMVRFLNVSSEIMGDMVMPSRLVALLEEALEATNKRDEYCKEEEEKADEAHLKRRGEEKANRTLPKRKRDEQSRARKGTAKTDRRD